MARTPKKTKVDPLEILRSIAADPEEPAHARVAAAKTLLQHERDAGEAEPTNDAPRDVVTQRALRLLKGGKS